VRPYYEDGQTTIYHGDCREILPTLESVDLVLTDPPYGIGLESHGQWFREAEPMVGDTDGDSYTWLDGLDLPLSYEGAPA